MGPKGARVVLLALAVVAGIVVFRVPAHSVDEHAADEAFEHTHGPDGLHLDPRGRRTVEGFAVDDALSPADWASTAFERSSTAGIDAPDAPDLVGLPQVHLVYVYPKDKLSRFDAFAKLFQADARAASALLSSLYGRPIRLDEWQKAPGTRFLDITPVKSASSSRQLGGGKQFNLVHNDLLRVYPTSSYPNKKFIAWLDAGSRYCGQGHLYQDTRRDAGNSSNMGRTTGIVYRPYSSTDPNTGGFCRGRTFLHELGHTLGAVQHVAPHAFDGAHCNDDDNDVMCYTAQSPTASASPQFDYGNDDYWDPPGSALPWWTVNLNRYVCPASGCGT